MTDAFRNVQINNLGEIGDDTKNLIQQQYDRATKKFATEKELEGGIGSLKALVSGKKLGEAIEERVKPIIKRKVGEEYRAFKNKWVAKAKEHLDGVLKPEQAVEGDEELPDNLASVSTKAENLLVKAKSIQSRLNKIGSKSKQARAVSKEAQADRLEAQLNETEQLAKDAGFSNATTDENIPIAVRQATKAKYAKMGKLRDEAKNLRRQNQVEASEEQQTSLTEAQPVSNQAKDQVENPNGDVSQEAEAKSLGKAQLKSQKPDNTPKVKGKGEEEVGEGEEEATAGDDVAETVTEALGQALDDTGVLAPIGLLLGAVGIGLGADKKGKPTEMTDRTNENSYSYQVGIN